MTILVECVCLPRESASRKEENFFVCFFFWSRGEEREREREREKKKEVAAVYKNFPPHAQEKKRKRHTTSHDIKKAHRGTTARARERERERETRLSPFLLLLLACKARKGRERRFSSRSLRVFFRNKEQKSR